MYIRHSSGRTRSVVSQLKLELLLDGSDNMDLALMSHQCSITHLICQPTKALAACIVASGSLGMLAQYFSCGNKVIYYNYEIKELEKALFCPLRSKGLISFSKLLTYNSINGIYSILNGCYFETLHCSVVVSNSCCHLSSET